MIRVHAIGTWLFSCLGAALLVVAALAAPDFALADAGSCMDDCRSAHPNDPPAQQDCMRACCDQCNGDSACEEGCCTSACNGDQICIAQCIAAAKLNCIGPACDKGGCQAEMKPLCNFQSAQCNHPEDAPGGQFVKCGRCSCITANDNMSCVCHLPLPPPP